MVILFDQYNLSDDVFEIIFATEQQVEVAKLLIAELKNFGGKMTKTQMSDFANRLHDGFEYSREEQIGFAKRTKQQKVSYNKRQFYDRILTPMKGMGMIDYDLYKKTYNLSDKFTKTINKVAQLWVQESKKIAS
ncbi:MAG: hypothetical protein ACMXYF_04685 [Candidatus Woesearchaeota archaeon]